jgi:hypothetical protein
MRLIFETLVDEGGQNDVVVAQALAVVSGQRHLDLVVHVEPFRMVVHRFGLEKGCVTSEKE